jgi:hypothetical protein
MVLHIILLVRHNLIMVFLLTLMVIQHLMLVMLTTIMIKNGNTYIINGAT